MRQRLPGCLLRLADQLHHACVFLGRAVGEVQPEHRGARAHQALHHLRCRARRSERADELRACHQPHTMSETAATTRAASSSAACIGSEGSENVGGHRFAGARGGMFHPRGGQFVGQVPRGTGHLGERERPRPRCDLRPPVAAPAGGDPPPSRHAMREFVQDRRPFAVRAGREPQLGQRIGVMGVAAQLGHEHVGSETPQRLEGRSHGAPRAMRRRRCRGATAH